MFHWAVSYRTIDYRKINAIRFKFRHFDIWIKMVLKQECHLHNLHFYGLQIKTYFNDILSCISCNSVWLPLLSMNVYLVSFVFACQHGHANQPTFQKVLYKSIQSSKFNPLLWTMHVCCYTLLILVFSILVLSIRL